MNAWPKRFQNTVPLDQEPEADKAVRLLRGLRHWLGLKYRRVTVIQLDGERIIMIHAGSANLPPEADTEPEVTA